MFAKPHPPSAPICTLSVMLAVTMVAFCPSAAAHNHKQGADQLGTSIHNCTKRHEPSASITQTDRITAIPKKRPSLLFAGSLKDPVYHMEKAKAWSCAFYDCSPQSMSERNQTSYKQKQPPMQNSHSEPMTPSKQQDRLNPPSYQQHSGKAAIATLQLDSELKRLLLSLLKKQDTAQNQPKDTHCQDMIKGIAYKVHNSQQRTMLAAKTRDMALDMQYFCRRKHYLKAYGTYQKLLSLIEGEEE